MLMIFFTTRTMRWCGRWI